MVSEVNMNIYSNASSMSVSIKSYKVIIINCEFIISNCAVKPGFWDAYNVRIGYNTF